ncbi:L-rhamnose-binding lectin SML-like [Syngnathoides biaculeatus]|uniref:L-rhamnose-binding lectin SML-like n=1 Tax=Syngnathoides biaculeatus TaxID=300417 RepID=UPI002ADD92C4|nr:L-rhamnose-binding lectin SML-like [Syngnathoides biaculeatus]
MFSCSRLRSALLLAATCLFIPAVADFAEQVTTCDWFPLNIHRLSCEHGVINVQQSLYGRSSAALCAEGKSPEELANLQCARQGTVDHIKTRCNGKMTCEMIMEDFRTPDPCAGIAKYLQTNFTCLPAITVLACESSEADLYCDLGDVILVYGADYGRRDRTTCSYRRAPAEIENTECFHPTDLVAKRCDGKTSCKIPASNEIFGDPCEGTYKYLEVAYTCIQPGTNLSNGM